MYKTLDEQISLAGLISLGHRARRFSADKQSMGDPRRDGCAAADMGRPARTKNHACRAAPRVYLASEKRPKIRALERQTTSPDDVAICRAGLPGCVKEADQTAATLLCAIANYLAESWEPRARIHALRR